MANKILDTLIQDSITGSSLDIDGIQKVREKVEEYKPNVILELGSGVSTLAFAQCESSFSHLFSVDDSDHYLEISKNRIPDLIRQKMTFIHAPIFPFRFKGETFQTYEFNAIKNKITQPIDFVFIDGPYARKYGRTATLPLITPFLSQKVIVILDDAHRQTEEEAVATWQKIWPNQLTLMENYSIRKGLKVFELVNPQKMALTPFGFRKWVKSFFY